MGSLGPKALNYESFEGNPKALNSPINPNMSPLRVRDAARLAVTSVYGMKKKGRPGFPDTQFRGLGFGV